MSREASTTTYCRNIPAGTARPGASLADWYVALGVRREGEGAPLPPPATFITDRFFNVAPLNDPDTRACLLRTVGGQDLNETLALIDSLRLNHDPNVITQSEIENYVWGQVRQLPESAQWDRMRTLGDGTMQRLQAVLGLAQFLTTEPPAAATPTRAPAPEAVTATDSWYRQTSFWVVAGGLAAAGVTMFLLGRATRARDTARLEANAAETRLREMEPQVLEAQAQLREIEAETLALRTTLEPMRNVDLAPREARLQELQRRLEAPKRRLSRAAIRDIEIEIRQIESELAAFRGGRNALDLLEGN